MPEIDRPQPSLRRWGSREGPLFGRYELGKLLGCGAFAKVYHARDVRTGLSVAIKIINKSRILSSSGLVCNVKREIAIMKKLHNPHIVKLHEVLASKTKIYFVMEFVKGGELFAKVSKGRLSESLSRKYFQQLISAVGYCHSRGVYHRDLKPENILIDENGVLKVSDFGLSAFTGQIHNDGLLHTLCGTPAYVAPEILAKRGYDGAKADIWSCGVILFVLTAGYLPFNESNLMMMYKKIYKGEYRCPKWMSADLKRFLSRILDTNPETRITVDEIIRDPWFTKGLTRQMKFYDEDYDPLKTGEEIKDTSPLNAFDLISFSSGLNLSGLFDESCISTADNTDRLVVGESPEKVIERCEEIAKGHEAVRIKKGKEWVLEFVGGQNGNMSLELEVYYLMENLVVVDVKSRGANGEGLYHDLWKQKIRPQLLGGGGRCREAEA